MLALYVHLSTYLAAAGGRIGDDERGQASAEYALVLLGAAAVALLIVAWPPSPTWSASCSTP